METEGISAVRASGVQSMLAGDALALPIDCIGCSFGDFRSDSDHPPETPMTPEEFELYEKWIDECFDDLGQEVPDLTERDTAAFWGD